MSRGNENEESRRAALQGVKIMRGLLPRPTSAKASSRERELTGKKERGRRKRNRGEDGESAREPERKKSMLNIV